MDLALSQSAFNQIISESGDRANGIFHPTTGEVIAQGDTGLPVFIGVMQYAVQSALAAFPNLDDGDVVVMNDPYLGGTHLMDVKLIRPFYHDGERVAILANCGHWADIGGNTPGGFGARATHVIQEGVRIPPILLQRKGVLQTDILAILFANVRVPEERLGDLQAQIAALNVGEQRMSLLFNKYGADTVDRYTAELARRSERQMRAYIAEMPDGEYHFESYLDSDGIDPDPVKIAVTMTVNGDELTFDFSESSPPVKGPMNGTRAGTFATVLIALKHVFPEVPINGGVFKPIRMVLPDTTFLNASYPRPVSGSSVEVSLRIFDVILGCMAQAVPERVPAAGFGTGANFTLSGLDPERGRPYIMFRFSGGGYGGHVNGDGLTNGNCPTSVAKTAALEVLEQLYPISFDYYRIREGSAGAGKYRGGYGTEYCFRILRGEAVSSCMAERGKFPPYGLAGGSDSTTTIVEYTQGGQVYRPLHITKDQDVPLAPGDQAMIATPGGGGFGDPLRRDPTEVLADVRLEYETRETADRVYGVVIRESAAGPAVDFELTSATRSGALERRRRRELAHGSVQLPANS